MRVIETKNGHMMFMENDLGVGRSLHKYGEVNCFKIDFLKKLLSKEDMVVDVGANIGTVTVPLAKHVSEGYVLALEPFTYNFFMLCGNIALNQLTNVQAFNRAGGDNSKAVFYFPSIDVNSEVDLTQIELASILNAKDLNGRKCENPVSSISIDDMNLAKPKLIKISAQGMESAILNGARKTIDRSTPYLYITFNKHKSDILKVLDLIGYEFELHEPSKYNPNNFLYNKVNELGDDVTQYLFCYPIGDRPDVEDEYLRKVDKNTLMESLSANSNAEFTTV